ncbi:DUF3623 family protein [Fulvimarina endophytica]|uniref:DUF3623 family protein n=1 Tax=Fulvimarina endophytica TaxID=2293836 RepID=A0A371X5E0_9HYPH|nr:DUF3623 family protein [Fulvimarina endophytica]RFC64435.1 DUF3623 family protein [Fulvimarina endophytica]
MTTLLAGFAAVVLLWWLSTGLILLAVRRFAPGGHGFAGLLCALLVLALLLAAPAPGLDEATRVKLGFLSGLTLWGLHELLFLAGWLTGPRREAAPGWRHATFREAAATVSDRHLALALTAALLALSTLAGAEAMALWSFLLLWGLRVLAEINLFLGAPHAPTGLVPPRLRYLATYFRRDRVSPLFPLTVNLILPAAIVSMNRSVSATDEAEAVAAALLGALLALGILEMFFLVLPFGEDRLWRWAGPPATGRTPRKG